jgi:hypothetical protein
MKTKMTRQETHGWNGTIQVGYCDLYYLLCYKNAYGFNCGVYGWNYDAYMHDGVGINTGYRGMIGKKVDYKLTNLYNEKGRAIYNNDKLTYKQKKAYCDRLLSNYLKKVGFNNV